MLELMKKHLAAYSSGDWDVYKADLASDVTYEEIATRQHVQGVDAYLKLVQRWKKAFPDLKATVINGFELGDRAVAEIEWEGTHGGPFEGPFGTIAATNKRGKVRAVIVTTMKNGKVTESRHYFDLLSLLSQIGAAPVAGAGAQPAKAAAIPPARH